MPARAGDAVVHASYMNIFLFQWPLNDSAYVEALFELQKAGHHIRYWVYSNGSCEAIQPRFPDTIFHAHADALEGVAPTHAVCRLQVPPDRALIARMSQTELFVLSMMNKHFDWMSIDERKQVYYTILGYWQTLIEREKDVVLVFVAVPHSVYDFVAYEISRVLGAHTVMFDPTFLGDRLLCMRDFREGSRSLARSLLRLKDKTITPSDISADLREYYVRQRFAPGGVTPLYMIDDRKKYAFKNRIRRRAELLLHSARDLSVFKKAFQFIGKVVGLNVRKEYAEVACSPDLSQPFVYVPLNYQPECTTSPQGDIFVVQTLMLETLSAGLPEGWHIYVKEHPAQWGPRGLNFSSSRYQGYYRRVSRIPGVTMVSLSVSNFELIAQARAVATVSGTAGLEALLRGKPVLVFGYPWYQNYPGLMRVDGPASCRACLQKIRNGLDVSEQDALRFLKAVDESAVRGYFDRYVENQSSLSHAESAHNLVGAVLQELNANEHANKLLEK